MSLYQRDVQDQLVSNKERLKELFYKQQEGTETLYQGLGYFMMMELWETINGTEFVTKLLSASGEDDYGSIYTDVMDLMMKSKQGMKCMDQVNNMIFNIAMIRENYEDCPERFVEKLRECRNKEQRLLKSHHGTVTVIDVEHSQFETPVQTERDRVSDRSPVSSPALVHMEDIEEDFKSENDVAFQTPLLDQMKETLWAHCGSFEDKFSLLKECLKELEGIKYEFLRRQALMEVGLMKKEDLFGLMNSKFSRYATFLSELVISFDDSFPVQLVEIIKAYLEIALIVMEHPKGFSNIVNCKEPKSQDEAKREKKRKLSGSKRRAKDNSMEDAEPEDNRKDKKEFKCKPCSKLSAKLMILGGLSLSFVEVKSHSVLLTNEEGEKKGRLSVPSHCIWKECEISYDNVQLDGYTRATTTHTRNEFVRLLFNITVVFCQQEFELKHRSLPFNLVTSAGQSVECSVTRLWYIFCNDGNMYSNCHFNEKLKKDRFLDMLNKVVEALGNGKKSRGLNPNDLEFLWRMRPTKEKNPEAECEIKENLFTKDKIGKTADAPIERKFTVSTWFSAFVHSIQNYLLKPWVDGIIYGLMSKQEAEKVLGDSKIPDFTALLRPARSFVMNGEIKIAVEFKYRKNGFVVWDIMAIEFAQRDLYNELRSLSVRFKGKSKRIQYVLTSNGLVSLDSLKGRYPQILDPAPGYHRRNEENEERKYSELIHLDGDTDVESSSSQSTPSQADNPDNVEDPRTFIPRLSPFCEPFSASTNRSNGDPVDWSNNVATNGSILIEDPAMLEVNTGPINQQSCMGDASAVEPNSRTPLSSIDNVSTAAGIVNAMNSIQDPVYLVDNIDSMTMLVDIFTSNNHTSALINDELEDDREEECFGRDPMWCSTSMYNESTSDDQLLN